MNTKEQHAAYCKYLDRRAMTVDVWDGDTLIHFGMCRVPLYFFMRQGEPKVVYGQEFDVIDSKHAKKVASL
jgi:hypothetical protein